MYKEVRSAGGGEESGGQVRFLYELGKIGRRDEAQTQEPEIRKGSKGGGGVRVGVVKVPRLGVQGKEQGLEGDVQSLDALEHGGWGEELPVEVVGGPEAQMGER